MSSSSSALFGRVSSLEFTGLNPARTWREELIKKRIDGARATVIWESEKQEGNKQRGKVNQDFFFFFFFFFLN